jgi:hypothetical protein
MDVLGADEMGQFGQCGVVLGQSGFRDLDLGVAGGIQGEQARQRLGGRGQDGEERRGKRWRLPTLMVAMSI